MKTVRLRNGRRFEYVDRGSGPELLIVHPGGPGLTHEYLRPLLQLGSKRRRVVLFHPRGVGHSYRPRSVRGYTLPALCEDVDGIRGQLGADRFDLLGFSAGGFVALEYALRYPGRLRSLLLCGTAGSAADLREANHWMLGRASPEQRRRLRSLERAAAFTRPEYLALVEELEQPFQSRYLRAPSRDLSASRLEPHVYRAMMTRTGNEFVVDGTLARWDTRSRLGRLRLPTLVLVGAGDFLAPASRRIARGIRGARLVVLPRTSHLAHLERPREYLHELRGFLDSLPRSGGRVTGGPPSRARARAVATRSGSRGQPA